MKIATEMYYWAMKNYKQSDFLIECYICIYIYTIYTMYNIYVFNSYMQMYVL